MSDVSKKELNSQLADNILENDHKPFSVIEDHDKKEAEQGNEAKHDKEADTVNEAENAKVDMNEKDKNIESGKSSFGEEIPDEKLNEQSEKKVEIWNEEV